MHSHFEKQFLSFWEKHFQNQAKEQSLVLSLSGGVDSQVMLHCFQKLLPQQAITLLHFNFHIRQEAHQDILAIQAIAKQAIELIHYQPENTNRNNEIQIRNFRLSTYQQKIEAKEATAVCCAHHLNDSIETLLFNLSRGTGLKGLAGIAEISGFIWHPMLFASKKDIIEYAQEEKLPFIIDSTNSDLSIKRNRIRNEIMPQFQALNPSFLSTMGQNLYRYQALQKGLDTLLEQSLQVWKTEHPLAIPIHKILEHPFREEVMMALYKPYKVQYHQAREAIALLPHLENGKFLSFGRYLFLKHKNQLALNPTISKE